MINSVVTSKGQTTLPKVVRETLGIAPGDRVQYVILDNDEVKILRTGSLARLFGICRYNGPPVTLNDMERAIEKKVTGE